MASSEYWQVLHAKLRRWLSGSSLGYSILELCTVSKASCFMRRVYNYHSLQKRKVICSIFFVSSPVLDAGEAMMGVFRDDVIVRARSRCSGIGTVWISSSRRLQVSVGPLLQGYLTVAGVARFVERGWR